MKIKRSHNSPWKSHSKVSQWRLTIPSPVKSNTAVLFQLWIWFLRLSTRRNSWLGFRGLVVWSLKSIHMRNTIDGTRCSHSKKPQEQSPTKGTADLCLSFTLTARETPVGWIAHTMESVIFISTFCFCWASIFGSGWVRSRHLWYVRELTSIIQSSDELWGQGWGNLLEWWTHCMPYAGQWRDEWHIENPSSSMVTICAYYSMLSYSSIKIKVESMQERLLHTILPMYLPSMANPLQVLVS